MSFLEQYPQVKMIRDLSRVKKREVYLVGGFLRDYLLGVEGKDFDFAVDCDALKFSRSFAKKIKGTFVLLDEDHGCARVVKKDKGELFTFDFADYRAKTLKEDLSHRDFTINTISVDVTNLKLDAELNDVIKDNKNALRDLKEKRIKRTSAQAFKDDPLRMLRAFSLKAVLGFAIEQDTLNQIKKDKKLIHTVSSERICDELFKILETPNAAKIIKSMDRIAFLEEIIPQIRVMFNCKQGAYHHLDVWPHSKEVLVQTEIVFDQLKNQAEVMAYLNQPIAGSRTRKSIIKLAALLHDIGKPETRKKVGNKYSFHGHEGVGKRIVKPIAKLLKLSTQERRMLEDMVFWHLRPGYLSNFKNPTKKAIYRYFRDTKQEAVSILLLSLADQRSTCGPLTTKADQKHHEKICLRLVKQYFNKKKEKPFVRLLTGDDLIKKLDLEPSPQFSKILKEVEEHQSLGKIKTKFEALNLAKKLAQK